MKASDTGRVKRSETPEWQQAQIQGALDHLADLERRGIIRPDQQARLDLARNTGTFQPPQGGFFDGGLA